MAVADEEVKVVIPVISILFLKRCKILLRFSTKYEDEDEVQAVGEAPLEETKDVEAEQEREQVD